MSHEAMNYVVGLTGERISTREVAVLMVLANRHNPDTKNAWPSLPRMVLETHMSRRGLQKCLARLESRGIIRRVKGVGRGNTTVYTFPGLDGLKSAAPAGNESVKGERSTPFMSEGKGERSTPFVPEKANLATNKRRTSEHRKGELGDTQRRTTVEPQLEPSASNPVLGRTDEAKADWKKISAELKASMNLRSWETWVRPLSGAGIDGKTLVVWVPTREFSAWIGENYAGKILLAAKRLGLGWSGLRFVVRGSRSEGGGGPGV